MALAVPFSIAFSTARRIPFLPWRWVALLSFLGSLAHPVQIQAETLAVSTPKSGTASWNEIYESRLKWWSLQPPVRPPLPSVQQPSWTRNEIDRFILARLNAAGLRPADEASLPILARRLSLVLVGLPPTAIQTRRLAESPHDGAYERFVDELLENPHFGERWARHWMDVVHYSDTHGYEWDVPAKQAWRYRDYLVRAFNHDVPFNRMILEQLAGDLIEPRVDPASGVNESLIGPMALRLGERRHGDNAAAEGVTQEAVANMIDTVSKGFLATTVACSQCHDHKLDAVSQRDYYALAGLFMNTRWSPQVADARDPNAQLLPGLRRLKSEIRAELGQLWRESRSNLAERIRALPRDSEPTNTAKFPESIGEFWRRSAVRPVLPDMLRSEQERRRAINATNLVLVADFSKPGHEGGWQWDGSGMRHGLVEHGEPVISDTGTNALLHLLPAGRWSHAWSQRLAGRIQSPLSHTRKSPVRGLSLGLAAGQFAARAFIIEHAFHSERMAFIQQPLPGWLTLKSGDFDTLEGGIDQLDRRVYLEIATKSLNNYFPPRTSYGGLKESDLADERSWFGVSRIYSHAPQQPRLDELGRFEPLADSSSSWDDRLADLLLAAVHRWSAERCDEEDVYLINDALRTGLLEHDTSCNPRLSRLVAQYRELERGLRPDTTVGTARDWHEAVDERIAVRGNYNEFGEPVPRGNIALLGGPARLEIAGSSGRLEFARAIASPDNPLTARVIVNRVWQFLFGEGLVRTPDDFGHLGEKPSHPELLDFLACRFVADGWSIKRLVRFIVTSSTWRQEGRASSQSRDRDPENRLLHHYAPRRLDAETLRDSMLSVASHLNPTLFGPPLDPPRAAEDAAKRLLSGPVDGFGRRSLYTKVTLMEPPRFLATFNQPIPKQTTGKRDVTQVPDQALALLNDPLVLALSAEWGRRAARMTQASIEQRIREMFLTAFARPPEPHESARLERFVLQTASLRGIAEKDLMHSAQVWQDFGHAVFNMKEFLHVF